MWLLALSLLLIKDVPSLSGTTPPPSTTTTTLYTGPPTTTKVYTGPPTTTTSTPSTTTLYTGLPTTTTVYTGPPTTTTSTTSTTTTPSTTTVTTTRYTGPPTTTTLYTGPPTTTTSTTSTTTVTPSTTTVSTTPYTGPPTTTTTGPSTTTTLYTGPPTTTTVYTGPLTTTTDTTTSTTTTDPSSTTTVSPTTTTGCVDLNNNSICDAYEQMRCETVVLQGRNYLIARIIMYIATGWVVFWCLLTILINICHKNSGHHRGIHLWEELGIIVLWVFMGVLNLTFRNKNASGRDQKSILKKIFQLLCKIISIGIHYFIVFIAACFVFEAIFANSMVHNKKKRNGCIPAFFNYILPVAIAALPSLLTYFLRKNSYGSNGMHCFVITELEIVYAFVIPVWVLLSLATLQSSLGNLACDLTHADQDQPQCYWAKKSCKVMPLLGYWIFLAYLTCMFGSSSQRLWVLILFVVQSFILGPMIFVCHTFVHKNTALKWYSPSLPGKFYRGCAHPAPLPPSPPYIPPLPMKSTPPPSLPPTPRTPKPRPAPTSTVMRRSPTKITPADDHMYANELWGWATTKNGDDAHFRPKPVSYDF